MERMKQKYLLILLTCALCLLLVSVVTAVPTALNIPWWSIDGGSGTASGGSYTLSGTSGQAEAGTLQGGAYTLGSGFWTGGAIPPTYDTFLPFIQQ